MKMDKLQFLEYLNTINETPTLDEVDKNTLKMIIKSKNVAYHSLWRIIHNFHDEQPEKQLAIFITILNYLKDKNCTCLNFGYKIFLKMINDNFDIFFYFKNKQEFWKFYHNLINTKLGKKIY